MKVVLDPADPQVQQACLVDVSVRSTNSPFYGYQPQPTLVDADGVLAPYLATLMR